MNPPTLNEQFGQIYHGQAADRRRRNPNWSADYTDFGLGSDDAYEQWRPPWL